MFDHNYFNTMGTAQLPGHLGIVITHIDRGDVHAELPIQQHLMAPNGFLHAGSIVTLADTAAGCGCRASLPHGANGFTTIELKSNHLSTAHDGTIRCVAKALHLGKTTQVWDATVTHAETGKVISLFRCTQMLLYPKAAS